MDWLQFISAIIGHIAWPFVVIVLLIVLRKHLGALAERIEEFSFGGAKFIWRKTLQEGREIIQQLPSPQPHVDAAKAPNPNPAVETKSSSPASAARPREITGFQTGIRRTRFKRAQDSLFRLTTIGAIITAYEEVEAILLEIGELIQTYGPQAEAVLFALKAEGWISDEIIQLFERISVGRNVIMHGDASPSDKDVAEYVAQSRVLKNYLSEVLAKLKARNS